MALRQIYFLRLSHKVRSSYLIRTPVKSDLNYVKSLQKEQINPTVVSVQESAKDYDHDFKKYHWRNSFCSPFLVD